MATSMESTCMDYTLINKRAFNKNISDAIYVTNMDINQKSPNPWLAVGLSSKTIEIMNIESLKTFYIVKPKTTLPITAVKFSKETTHELYSSSEEGCINLWDLRCQNSAVLASTFKDPEVTKSKAINCFDVSNDERFIVGGTDLVGSEAYLLFWDKRSSKILGGYWESHTDDVLDVGYHPTKDNILMSGGTDGLVNIFDLTHPNEDDALLNTLNSEKTVSKCKWLRGDYLSCVTHNEDLQIWNSVQVEKIGDHNKGEISAVELDYFIGTLQPTSCCSSPEVIGLLASGSHKGLCQIWSVNCFEGKNEATLQPWSILEGGHEDVLRCIAKTNGIFATGAEDGTICLWKEKTATSDLKIKSTLKENLYLRNKKPY